MDLVRPGRGDMRSTGSVDEIHPGHPDPPKIISRCCKAYVLIKSKCDPQYQHKHRKLDIEAHIGFFVGYESTNIYRVWIPI